MNKSTQGGGLQAPTWGNEEFLHSGGAAQKFRKELTRARTAGFPVAPGSLNDHGVSRSTVIGEAVEIGGNWVITSPLLVGLGTFRTPPFFLRNKGGSFELQASSKEEGRRPHQLNLFYPEQHKLTQGTALIQVESCMVYRHPQLGTRPIHKVRVWDPDSKEWSHALDEAPQVESRLVPMLPIKFSSEEASAAITAHMWAVGFCYLDPKGFQVNVGAPIPEITPLEASEGVSEPARFSELISLLHQAFPPVEDEVVRYYDEILDTLVAQARSKATASTPPTSVLPVAQTQVSAEQAPVPQ